LSYIEDVFANLKRHLEITRTEQDAAARRHHDIREFLDDRWDLADDFFTGSYRRDTKTKKLKDVDVFAVINDAGAQAHFRSKYPRELLSALELLLQEEWPNAHRDGMAVVVPYGDEEDVLSIEVVPAFDRDGGGYFIPDPDAGSWIPTNPKVHHELASPRTPSATASMCPS
jgi:tRNA nucleotidyltransferase (CCA-adding enzyme)